MMRLNRFAIAVLASATVVVGSLATPSTASAMDCMSAGVVEDIYTTTAWALTGMGRFAEAMYWLGKAHGIMAGCG
jgi:hypothetical protein